MAKVFLGTSESNSVESSYEVFGNSGIEGVLVRGTNNTIHSSVERIEFTGNLAEYNFSISGNIVKVMTGSTVVASIIVPDTATGQTLAFGNGSAALKITGLNQATLGGVAISQTAGAVIAPLNSADRTAVAAGHDFTLTEVVVEGEAAVKPTTAVYWGYNPHPHDESGVDNTAGGNISNKDNEGPADGGIPVADLVSFLTTITGLDLTELGLIDADGKDPFQNVTSLTLSNPLSPTNSNSGNTDDGTIDQGTYLNINLADGSTINAEVMLGDQYFTFLNNLLFDAEGNSRLFEKVIDPGTSGTSDHYAPIILTQAKNNGGTIESGYTTTGDDVIVAGRLELLHQAYIDGGPGHNILEIDAKGTYAQPLQLLNIQEIRVNDLPNFYTTGYGSGFGNLDNTIFTDAYTSFDQYGNTQINELGFPDPTGAGTDNSWIDINRATSISKLIVTDQGNGSGSDFDNSGDLTIVGVRNGATLRLENGFNSGTTTIQYGQGQTGTLNVELALGDVTQDINILQNSAVLNVNSEGVVNHMHSFFAGGSISRMIVKGTGEFAIDENIASSFNKNTAVIIDASANTGGLNINFDGSGDTDERFASVTVKGTSVNDAIMVQNVKGYTPDQIASNNGATTLTNGKVTIDAGNGENVVVTDGSSIVKVTTGTGDDTIFTKGAQITTIVAGDGSNVINADGSTIVTITSGVGSDDISAQNGSTVTIKAGAGDNNINVDSTTFSNTRVIDITTGEGKDSITAINAGTIKINAGDGDNTIRASALSITVTTGSGNDKLFISGEDVAYLNGDDIAADNTDNNSTDLIGITEANQPGAILVLDLGAGNNTVTLGRDEGSSEFGITALEGSSISGSNISLFVENTSDLTEAAIVEGTTFSRVTLKQELTITDDQFKAMGADKFAAFRAAFGATEDLHIRVDSDADLTTLLDGKALSGNVRLSFELHNGATLTLTAQQLHQNVAVGGLVGADGLNGKVKITGAGNNFDPFNNGETFLVIDGGTIAAGTLYGAEDVTIIRDGSFERPVPGTLSDTMTLGSATAVDPLIIATALVTEAQTLKIIGAQNVEFKAVVDLGADASANTMSGNIVTMYKDDTAGQSVNGVVNSGVLETDGFAVDFSGLTGTLKGLTLDHAQDLKSLKGNGAAGSRVDLILNADLGASGVNKGLVTSGVETIMVTKIDTNQDSIVDAASSIIVNLCDATQGVKFIGLKENAGNTVTFNAVPWGQVHPTILLEGDGYANWDSVGNIKVDGSPNTSDIGLVKVNYFTDGAPAVVNINNGGTELGVTTTGKERIFVVDGIELSNAVSLAINVSEGDVKLDHITGTIETLTVTATEDVVITDALPNSLTTINLAAVTGAFTAMLTDFTADEGSVITGGAGVTTFIIDGDTDLSEATLTAVDHLVLTDGSELTLDMADYIAVTTAGDITVEDPANDNATLNLLGLDGEEFHASLFVLNDGITLGDLFLADLPIVTLHPLTDLIGVGGLVVPEGTVLELSAAQFQQLADDGTITGGGSVHITGLTQEDVDSLDLNGDGDFTDVGEHVGFDLDHIDLSGPHSKLTITLAESVDLSDADIYSNYNSSPRVDVFNIAGHTLTLGDVQDANGVVVNGTAGSVLKFTDTISGAFESIDASHFTVDTLQMLNVLVANRNVDLLFFGLKETVIKEIYNDLGWVDMVKQEVTIIEGTTVPGFLVFNKPEDDVEIKEFVLNMNGGTEIAGNLRLSTSVKAADLLHTYLETVTINSIATLDDPATTPAVEGTNLLSGKTANIIKGDITALGTGNQGSYISVDNNLLNVTINATQAFELKENTATLADDGDIVFSSVDGDVYPDAHLTITGTAAVTVENLDVSDNEISTLHVANNGTATFTVTGASPGLFDNNYDDNFTIPEIIVSGGGSGDGSGDGLEQASPLDGNPNLEKLFFSGTGNIAFGTATGATGISAAELSVIDASALSGSLSLNSIDSVDETDFIFTAGTGTTTVSLTGGELNTAFADGDTIAAADENGWTFNYATAAVGSVLQLNAASTAFTKGDLNFNMGANATLLITGADKTSPARELVDLTKVDLTFTGTKPIVLGANVELKLTAAQASGLNIIADPSVITNPATPGYDANMVPKVTIIDLSTAVYDFSGIASVISGVVTLMPTASITDNPLAADVTLAATTNLGAFTVQLTVYDLGDEVLLGQTIRYNNVAQADNAVTVVAAVPALGATQVLADAALAADLVDGANNTNVVWLFPSITAPIDTSKYSHDLGRLWVTDALITAQGGAIENLFTTLQDSIVRATFANANLLDALLASHQVERTFEVESFLTLGAISFSDIGASPEEHIHSLNIEMGGQATVGAINIADVLGAPAITDPASVSFAQLTIDSHRALHQDDYMATETYVNDNDGIGETGEDALPNNINTVGNIGVVSAVTQIDLVEVNLRTGNLSVLGTGLPGSQGAILNTGVITYDYDATVAAPTHVALLDVEGANNINITAVNTADAQIPILNVVTTGFTAVLTAPGASPAFQLDNTETLTFNNGNVVATTPDNPATPADEYSNEGGTITLGSATNAGIQSNTLSYIDADNFDGKLNLGIIGQVDSTNDDNNLDGDTTDHFATMANRGDAAFVFNSGDGITTMTLAATTGVGNAFTPTLNAGSEWVFDYTGCDATSKLTLTSSAVLTAGGTLRLINVPLFIQGTVNLSTFGVDNPATAAWTEGLIFSGGSINVPAGQTLIISVAQLEQLDMVDIVGSGTVQVVGNASNINTLGTHLKTVNVDISGVTMVTDPLIVGFDINSALPLTLTGAINDANLPAGQTVLGSPTTTAGTPAFDIISTGALNDIITGNAGNDILTGGAGSNTFNVDAGTDSITDLSSELLVLPTDHNDVLVVSSGATAYAFVNLPQFVATAATINNGATNANAIIYGGTAGNTTIDMSAVTTGKGFTLIGGIGFDAIPNTAAADTPASPTVGLDVLIGSPFADILNGGNVQQTAAGAVDTLTGNGGADTFKFDVSTTTPLSLTVVSPNTVNAQDWETLRVSGVDTVNDPAGVNNETIQINYVFNNTANVLIINDATLNVLNAAAVATAVRNALNTEIGTDPLLGITATINAGDNTRVDIVGNNGNSIEITAIAVGGVTDGLAVSIDNATGDALDVAQRTLLTITGTTATTGEIYNISASLKNGTNIVADQYVAVGGETPEVLAYELGFWDITVPFDEDGTFNVAASAYSYSLNAVDTGVVGTITIEDNDADDGGFTVPTFTSTGSFGGSGASSNPNVASLNLAFADIITDFTTTVDKIEIGALAPAVLDVNYKETASVAFAAGAYAAAFALADTAINGTVIYYMTSIADDPGTAAIDPTGLLFFDANGNGTIDGVIVLAGVTDATFAAGDII